MFSSLTEHVELTFKLSTFQFIPPSTLRTGLRVNAVQVDKYSRQQRRLYIPSYSFYFALQSLPEINGHA